MSARQIPATGQAAAENELLAQLGLPPSASPEDVDQTHEAVSEFLAAAPPGIRGWAHAQAAALDAAYLTLTDPVGLQGSALRSPTRPPAVVPGGPATPPARRDPVPAAPPSPADDLDDLGADAQPDEEDVAALYASVTPSAHSDMGPDRRRRKKARRQAAAPVVAVPQPAGGDPWKKVALGGIGLALVIGVAFAGYAFGGGGGTPAASQAPQAVATPPAIDQSRVTALMEQLQANPDDAETLLSLADEFYAGGQYETAATWLDKLLAVDPEHVKALLARGAVYFNLNENETAEATWRKVLEFDPKNQEAYYDLGFMYFYQANPDYAAVQREWAKAIKLDPTTPLAQNAKAHLDALVAKSMIPTSPDASPAASPAAGASTAPTGTVLDQVATGNAFTARELKAPADSPFTIRFENKDTVSHNVEIKDGAGKTVFFGDLVKEPGTIEYTVPALAAGTYSFLCTVHPNMTGTLVVGS